MVDQVVIGNLTNSVHVECIRERQGKAGAVFSEGSRSARSPCRYSVFDEPTPPLCLFHLDRRKRSAPTDSSSNPTREPDLDTLASASSRCQRRPLTISRRVVSASSSDGYDQAASTCRSRGGRRRGTDGRHDPGPARSRESRSPEAGLEFRAEVVTVPTWQPRGGRAASVAPSALPSSCSSSWFRVPARLRRRRSRHMAPSLSYPELSEDDVAMHGGPTIAAHQVCAPDLGATRLAPVSSGSGLGSPLPEARRAEHHRCAGPDRPRDGAMKEAASAVLPAGHLPSPGSVLRSPGAGHMDRHDHRSAGSRSVARNPAFCLNPNG